MILRVYVLFQNYMFFTHFVKIFLYKIPYYGILYLERTTAILWKYSIFAGLA